MPKWKHSTLWSMPRISVENFLVAAHWAIQDIQGGLEMWIVWNCKWALVVAFTFIRLDFEILVDGYTVEIWTQSPIQLGWSLSHNSVFVHNWVWLYGGNMISITHSIGLEFQPQLCIHLYFSGHQDQSKFYRLGVILGSHEPKYCVSVYHLQARLLRLLSKLPDLVASKVEGISFVFHSNSFESCASILTWL